MLGDSGAVLVFAETDAHAEKIEALTGELPDLRKVFRIDGSGTVGAGCARRGGQVGRRRRTGRPAGRDQVDRPRHADLHLGHHRQAQGLPADPLQSGVRDPRGQGVLPDDLLDKGERLLVFLPLAHVLARAHHHRGVRQQGDGRDSPATSRTWCRCFGVFKPTLVVSVPRVFEKVYNTAEQNARNDGKGRIFERAVNTAIEWSQAQDDQGGAGSAAARQARAVRPAGLRQAARRARRQLPRRDLRWRAAGRAARPLLPRRRADHLRGLRADRDQCGDHGEPDRRREGRLGRKVVARQQHAARPTTTSCWCAAAWCSQATGATRRRPRPSSPTAGSTPAISARSTTTAS